MARQDKKSYELSEAEHQGRNRVVVAKARAGR